MSDLVITCARKASSHLLAEASQWAAVLEARIVPRAGRSLAALCQQEGVRGVLVLGGDRPVYHEPATGLVHFFHPNLAAVRIRNLLEGSPDHMVVAMGLGPGDEVLDCTMGFGADAILCAHVVGETGRVVAIEKVPVIAYLTIHGLRTSVYGGKHLTALMRRVDARCADHRDFLPACEDRSFDVVYFDPIFHEPVAQSKSMESLRALADQGGIDEAVVAEAKRVARRCVVIKQRRGTLLWEQLGVTQVHGGKQSRVEYGVIHVA